MNELNLIERIITNMLTELNPLQSSNKVIDEGIIIEIPFINNNNINEYKEFRIHFSQHIDRLHISLDYIKKINNSNDYIKYVNYINMKSLITLTVEAADIIRENTKEIYINMKAVNEYKENIIEKIIFLKNEIMIRFSSLNIEPISIKYDLVDIFLINEEMIKILQSIF